MRHVRLRSLTWIRLTSLITLMFAAGCGGSGGPTDSGDGETSTVPGTWSGVWEVTQTEEVCGGKGVADTTYTTTDTLCSGATIEETFMDPAASSGDGDLAWDCTGSFTSDEGSWECTAVETVDACTITHSVTFSGTREGDAISGGGEKRSAHAGDCDGVENSCATYTIDAVRTGGAPDWCSVRHYPNLPVGWGGTWEVHSVSTSCTTQETVGDSSYTEVMCANYPYNPGFCDLWDGFPGTMICGCDVTITDSTLTYHCEASVNYMGCIYNGEADYAVERDGDEYSGTARVTLWTSGSCPESQSDCFDVAITAQRVSGDQSGCGGGFPRSVPFALGR